MRCWFGGIFLVAVCFIVGRAAQLTQIPLLLIGMTIGSALIGIAIADTSYMRVLSMAPVSKVYPVVKSSHILFSMFIAGLFLGEGVTWSMAIGAIMIMSGVYLAAFAKTETKPNPGAQPVSRVKWLLLAIIVGVCWTLSFSLMKFVLRDVDALVANSIRVPVAALTLTLLMLRSGRGESLRVAKYGRATLGLLIATGTLSYGVGVLLSLYAVQFSGVTIAAILTSVTPIFVLCLSVLFLREELTPRLGLGTLLCTGGVAVIVAL